MHDTALVTAVSGKKITVIPLIKDACLSCKERCAKRGHPFEAANTKGLPLKEGSIVKINSAKKHEIAQAVFSLLFPISCAAGGYFLARPTAAALGKTAAAEGLQAGFVLLGFSAAAATVFWLSRKKIKPAQPEITEILS